MFMAAETTPSTESPLPPELLELGVREGMLPDTVRTSLDQDGYAVLPNLIPQGHLQALRAAFDELSAIEGASGGQEVHTEQGTQRLSNLVDKSAAFDVVYRDPVVLAAVFHVLERPFKLSSLNAREPMRGEGQQNFHADWAPRSADDPFHVVNSLWLLDAFTKDNGATRLIPGSQKLAGDIGAHIADLKAPHARELRLQAPAGTVVIFNAHTWHGGTCNVSGERRRVVHCYYTAREHSQQLVQRDHIRAETLARLSPAERWLLDV
ncbi:MAG TPA: phytanoyl-CoA dioxygenase family protein [Polyangiaceae bacterium]|nr:phytanoyl-CoA dioxygenase family protein [Polyangiaceae bacterium]